MTLKRLELRFLTTTEEDRALLQAFEAEEGYGEKARFLKARLLRGYVAVMRQVADIKGEPDPLAALDKLAHSVNAGHYRVLRALLYERQASLHEVPPAPAPAVERMPAAAPSEVRPSFSAEPRAQERVLGADLSQPLPPAAEAPVAGSAASGEPSAARGGAAPIAESSPAGAEQASERKVSDEPVQVPTQQRPKPNWGNFASIAGRRGG